jgi:hypothetical protein
MSEDLYCLEVSGVAAIMIRIEDPDRNSTSLPYVSLLALDLINSHPLQRLVGQFSLGVLEVTGENLEQLLRALENHLVIVIRKGVSKGEAGTKVKRVVFHYNNDKGGFSAP